MIGRYTQMASVDSSSTASLSEPLLHQHCGDLNRNLLSQMTHGVKRHQGIRGVLGRNNSTEQDTEGQHSQQQRAVHGKPSFWAGGSGQATREQQGEPIRARGESTAPSRLLAGMICQGISKSPSWSSF
jgi:hypothetical protein